MLTLYKANYKLTLSEDRADYGEYNQTYYNQRSYHFLYEIAMRTARNKYEHKVRDVIEEIHDLCGDLSYREGIHEEFYVDQTFARRIAKFVSSGYEPNTDLTRHKSVDVVDIYLCLAYFSCMSGWKTSDINVLKKHQNIAYYLAIDSSATLWTTNYKEILSFCDGKVALVLAKNSDKNGWTTDDKEILSLHQGGVAFWLSKCQKLSTSDSKILDLVEAYRKQYNKKITNLRKKLLHRGIQNMNNNPSTTKSIHGLNA